MQIESTLVNELHNWGWWAQDCPSRSLGYPSKANYAVVKSKTTLMIDDERAVEIDRAIAHLFNKDDKAIRAIKLYFVCGMSYRDIGKTLGVSKDKAKSIVDNCVSWLDGYFYKNS